MRSVPLTERICEASDSAVGAETFVSEEMLCQREVYEREQDSARFNSRSPY